MDLFLSWLLLCLDCLATALFGLSCDRRPCLCRLWICWVQACWSSLKVAIGGVLYYISTALISSVIPVLHVSILWLIFLVQNVRMSVEMVACIAIEAISILKVIHSRG